MSISKYSEERTIRKRDQTTICGGATRPHPLTEEDTFGPTPPSVLEPSGGAGQFFVRAKGKKESHGPKGWMACIIIPYVGSSKDRLAQESIFIYQCGLGDSSCTTLTGRIGASHTRNRLRSAIRGDRSYPRHLFRWEGST